MIECAAVGVRAGVGSPFFGSVESVVSQLAFSVPAVKAIAFGDGMALAEMRGSEANDAMRMDGDGVTCESNHNGGVTGRHHQRDAGDFPRGDQTHAVHRAGTADG